MDFEVAAFSSGGVTVSFREQPDPKERGPNLKGRTLKEALEDDDASTSSRPVSGFNQPPKDGWRNPNLWPGQAGHALKLDGSYE